MPAPFVHLHVHTKYSMLDGACHLGPLCKRAAELGMPALAMTDHGVMYGAIDFYKTCLAEKIKPIIGCEIYILARENRANRDRNVPYHHLVLLAENHEGYLNLAKINTIAHGEGFYYKPRIDKETLAAHSKGVIALSACLQGEVNGLLVEHRLDAAERAAAEYAEILGRDNFFLEMQDHGIPEQRTANAGVRELCRRTGLRAVVTNDVHYLHRSHAEAHEVMLCIQTQTVMSDPKRMRYATPEFYFKSREELQARFPEDAAAFDLTGEIAARCNVTLSFSTGKADSLFFPVYQVPEGFADGRGYLEHLGREGLRRLYGLDVEHPADDRQRMLAERFRFEVRTIENAGFINYFLVVADFIHWARTHGVPVGPGRGSGAGSILAYALGITQIDPIRFDLIFERFLNPERVSPPDFDIDFCQDRRDRVIEYVKQKYGSDRVAQIVTFGQLGAKTVIRDVGRVLELPREKVDAWAKMIPEDPKINLAKAKADNPLFDAACNTDPDLRRIMRYAEVLEGLYRNAGMHAAGVVIGDKPLREIVPLCRDKDGQPITQYAKEPIEECGLLKMDFLGLKTLTVLKEAVDLVQLTRRETVDLANLPLDDARTFQLFQRADTVGVFQLESGGMQRVLADLQPTRIEEIIAILALYRPGPMDMIPTFVKRKKKLEKIVYDHPLLEPILRETYGIMVYQEQVQRAAQALAGYSLGKADMLRRAMSRKKKEIMEKERAGFVAGCAQTNRIPEAQAGQIFDNIEKFAGYGFNKAHAAAYGIITYQTAYLKAHYPAEFMCAQISSEIGNFDKLPGFVTEAEAMGLRILAPDVNRSLERFVPEEGNIRYGLAGVKNVGAMAAEAIVRERAARGAFRSLVDFCRRVDPAAVNKRALEALIKCGALDGLGAHRARLLHGIDFAMARAAEELREQQTGQGNLFAALDGGGASSGAHGGELPDCPPMSERDLLAFERELLGIYVSGHPLDRYRRLMREFQTVPLARVAECPDNKDVRVAGLAAAVANRLTKEKKAPMAIVTLDDGDHKIEAVIFPEAFKIHGGAVQPDQPLLVCGTVSRRDDQPKLIVREVYNLLDAPRSFAEAVVVNVRADEPGASCLQQFRDLAGRSPGKIPTMLRLTCPDGPVLLIEAARELAVDPTPAFVADAEKAVGRNGLRFLARRDIYLKPRPERRWRKDE